MNFKLWLIGILVAIWSVINNSVIAAEFSSNIVHASLNLRQQHYVLNADVDFNLSPVAIQAVNSSIILTWQVQFELQKRHKWWSQTILTRLYNYQIRYHALLNSYSVNNQTTTRLQRFSSLANAIKELARIRNLTVFPANLLQQDENYIGRIKLDLQRENLPVPLRALSYFKTQWDLSSEWYVWDLTQ